MSVSLESTPASNRRQQYKKRQCEFIGVGAALIGTIFLIGAALTLYYTVPQLPSFLHHTYVSVGQGFLYVALPVLAVGAFTTLIVILYKNHRTRQHCELMGNSKLMEVFKTFKKTLPSFFYSVMVLGILALTCYSLSYIPAINQLPQHKITVLQASCYMVGASLGLMLFVAGAHFLRMKLSTFMAKQKESEARKILIIL
jgi:hypothetical protein